MDDVKRMDLREFRDLGFLQEANRLFFHPHGLALEVVIDEDGGVRLGGIWDYRDDPEGVVFEDPPDLDKVIRVDEELERHKYARRELFGDFWDYIQPPGWRP